MSVSIFFKCLSMHVTSETIQNSFHVHIFVFVEAIIPPEQNIRLFFISTFHATEKVEGCSAT